jgi:hypothetical protein
VLPKAELGEYAGSRSPAASRWSPTSRSSRRSRRHRERLARLETVERPAARGRLRRRRLRRLGTIDGEPIEGSGRRGPRPARRARRRQPDPGFEEGLLGASAGETRTVELTFPADYGNEELAGREASFEVTVKEVKREAAAGARRRLRDRRPASTRSRSCARTSAAPARGRRASGSRRVPRGRARRGGGGRARVTSPSSDRGAGARRCGSGCCTRSPTAASRARPTCRSPARGGGDPRRDAARRPSWRCAARR